LTGQALAASDRDFQARDRGDASERRKRALGVIARGRGLYHFGGTVRLKSRQEHRTLDLRAGDLRPMRNGVQS
jgi:hypothetical protein